MFYCEPCRLKNEWPTSFAVSYGPCELCKKQANCYDRPSSSLPANRAERRAVEVVMPGSFAEVDAVAEREKARLMPTLPLRVSFRQVLLLILADGRERAESEVMSYFAPEDRGGTASTLVKLAEEGEVARREESNGVKRVKRTAVRK